MQNNKQSITKYETRQHEGINYTININKSPINTYTAEVEIQYQTFNEVLYFPGKTNLMPTNCVIYGVIESGKENVIDIEKIRRQRDPSVSGSFDYNPYFWVIEYIEGWIDGRKSIFDLVGIDPESTEKYKQIKEEALNMRPHTKPTEEQKAQMQAAIDKLVDTFSTAGLAHLTGEPTSNIVAWSRRGRISAKAAHRIAQIPQIAAIGMTREDMRPDVPSWVQVDVMPANKKSDELKISEG